MYKSNHLHITFTNTQPRFAKAWTQPHTASGIFTLASNALNLKPHNETDLICGMTRIGVYETPIDVDSAKQLMTEAFPPSAGWHIVANQAQNRLMIRSGPAQNS